MTETENIVASEARPITERLARPGTHSPVKLRADALAEIERLQSQVAGLREALEACIDDIVSAAVFEGTPKFEAERSQVVERARAALSITKGSDDSTAQRTALSPIGCADEIDAGDATGVDTDGSEPDVILREIIRCAHSWEPAARIIGNIRAGDIVRAVFTAMRGFPPSPTAYGREWQAGLEAANRIATDIGNDERHTAGERSGARMVGAIVRAMLSAAPSPSQSISGEEVDELADALRPFDDVARMLLQRNYTRSAVVAFGSLTAGDFFNLRTILTHLRAQRSPSDVSEGVDP